LPVSSRPTLPSPRRWIAVVLLVLAAGAVSYVVSQPGSGNEYRILFDDAGQLVVGDLVRIGGAPAGTVEEVELAEGDRAAVRIRLDPDRPPLRAGTTAAIRAQGLTGIASRYVDLSPGPGTGPELDEGATIGTEDTQSIVEVDELFNTLDDDTRAGLRRLIHGSGDWYRGKTDEANEAAKYFSPAVAQLAAVAEEITRDSATFEDFIVEVGDAMSALADRRAELTSAVSGARATASALAADTSSLRQALGDLPPALREGADAMASLRAAIGDLERLVDATDEPSRELAGFVRDDLRPVLERSGPVFRRLRTMLAQPGEANDALDALRDLPRLASLVDESFPRAMKALDEGTPIFRFVRPYVPDLVGWARGFGAALATYDANGHYARTVPVFDAFRFTDDAQGGRLDPKPFAARGRSEAVTTGNLRRCPGTAGPLPDDGSAPYVDTGDEANPDCDPAQVVGRSR
jgi:phospholipid/cholesterol/gamma-HCH transport system substrate-binding protein